MPRRTRITTTITETFAVMMPADDYAGACAACGGVSRFVTFDRAIEELGIGVGEFVRRIAAGEVHWIEVGGRFPLFCVGPGRL